jgi:hypothetical protein
MSKKPYLANYIRSVVIEHRPGTLGAIAPADELELSTLLPLINHAEELSLHHILWRGLSSCFRSALLKFLRTPHMKGISLQGSHDFPLYLLDDLKHIKNLKIGRSRCDFEPLDNAQLRTPTSLESLSLVSVSLASEKYTIWAGPRLTCLISLHVGFHPIPNLSAIIGVCSESLKALTLSIGCFCTFLFPSDLSTT